MDMTCTALPILAPQFAFQDLSGARERRCVDMLSRDLVVRDVVTHRAAVGSVDQRRHPSWADIDGFERSSSFMTRLRIFPPAFLGNSG